MSDESTEALLRDLGASEREHIPGAEAPIRGRFGMSGLKPRPISEAKTTARTSLRSKNNSKNKSQKQKTTARTSLRSKHNSKNKDFRFVGHYPKPLFGWTFSAGLSPSQSTKSKGNSSCKSKKGNGKDKSEMRGFFAALRMARFFGGHEEGIPQGLKLRLPWVVERPKAEALGCLDVTAVAKVIATAAAEADSFGDDNQENGEWR